ncbi:MAG: PQQ-binding-like beta-propeller repeat protein, partial [Planctomycetes bacterium]|nr:PQQ-binding-like beta-propeller repeat protein [Planctomycetota bacterium]
MKRCVAVFVLVGLLAGPAWAVKPVTVAHLSQADFAEARADNVVVWSLGEVALGREAKTIMQVRQDVGLVSAVAVGTDGRVYVGTGTEGLVLCIEADGTVKTLADLESTMVSDLLLDGDRLLAATAGAQAGVYVIDLAEVKGRVNPKTAPADQQGDGDTNTDSPTTKAVAQARKLWSDPDVSCVWALAMADDTLYAATAANGRVYAIDGSGRGKVIFTAEQKKTIRSIVATAGVVFAGTGDDGLVFRIDVSGPEATSRVLLDAAEREIAALALDGAGNLYVAATNVTSAGPSAPAETEGGRPVIEPVATQPIGEPPTDDTATTRPAPTSRPTVTPNDTKTNQTGLDKDKAGIGSDDKPISAPGSTENSEGAGKAASLPASPASPAATAAGARAGVTLPTKPAKRLPGRSAADDDKGNTIYHIDSEGFVRTVGKEKQT